MTIPFVSAWPMDCVCRPSCRMMPTPPPMGSTGSGLHVTPARLEVENKKGLERRHSLPDIARDVERGLGPVRRHERAAEARELLLQAART